MVLIKTSIGPLYLFETGFKPLLYNLVLIICIGAVASNAKEDATAPEISKFNIEGSSCLC